VVIGTKETLIMVFTILIHINYVNYLSQLGWNKSNDLLV
jgi:hypothetical protein